MFLHSYVVSVYSAETIMDTLRVNDVLWVVFTLFGRGVVIRAWLDATCNGRVTGQDRREE